jgi:hypothetical protein
LRTIAWGLQIRADMHARQIRAARAQRRQWSAAAPSQQRDDQELLKRLLGE